MAEPAPPPRIRTYHGRHGRATDRMRHVLGDAGRRRSLDARPEPDRPVVLEVGCGHGEAALAFARHRHDVDVLATDVHTPGVVHLLEAADAAGLDNLFVERADAVDLLDGPLQDATVVGVHLFFPDPWPKTRHHKRRFVRPDILDLLADRVPPGGWLLVATDVADYARWTVSQLDADRRFRGGPSNRPAWRPVTRYEQAAVDAGRAVTELRYERG